MLTKVGLDGCDMKIFRLISNRSFLSNLLANVVRSRTGAHLGECDMMSRNQSVHCRNHSADTATLKTFRDIASAIDSHCLSILFLLYLLDYRRRSIPLTMTYFFRSSRKRMASRAVHSSSISPTCSIVLFSVQFGGSRSTFA